MFYRTTTTTTDRLAFASAPRLVNASNLLRRSSSAEPAASVPSSVRENDDRNTGTYIQTRVRAPARMHAGRRTHETTCAGAVERRYRSGAAQRCSVMMKAETRRRPRQRRRYGARIVHGGPLTAAITVRSGGGTDRQCGGYTVRRSYVYAEGCSCRRRTFPIREAVAVPRRGLQLPPSELPDARGCRAAAAAAAAAAGEVPRRNCCCRCCCRRR